MDIFTFYKYNSVVKLKFFAGILLIFFALTSFTFEKELKDSASKVSFIDQDGDGVLDAVDIDDDGDGILDTVEGYHATSPRDTDQDGIPDYLDLDSDNDGILDNVEAQSTKDYIPPSGNDSNKDGLDDAYDNGVIFGLTPINTDEFLGGNGHIPDYLDVDSDIDGIRDNIEAQNHSNYVAPSGDDLNRNGLDDAYEGFYGFGIIPVNSDTDEFPDFRDFDSDGDGIKDKREAQTYLGYLEPIGDNNANDIDDAYEAGLDPLDTDNDGIWDFQDVDSDNDGIYDNIEAQTKNDYIGPRGRDNNNDGMDDAYGGGLIPIDTDSDNNPDYRDTDSDNDSCSDTMEAGFIDAFLVENRDDRLGNAIPPVVNSMGKVVSGENGQGYTTPLDSNSNGIWDFREATFYNACGSVIAVVDDTATTEENTPVDIDILANDSNIPSDGTLTVTTPDNGVVVINDGGTPDDISDDTITYTPNDGFTGEDTFDYTICDTMGNCDTGTVTITINAPMLDVVDDTATTDANTPVDIDILANDSNIPSDGTLTVTSPDNGVVVINDGGTPDDISDDTITYTPNDGFTGEDSFDYTVCDAMGTCDTGTITITVNAPMLDVVDDTATTDANTPVDIDILANDSNIPSDGTLTVTTPDNGVAVINDGGTPDDISDDTITYTPNDGFTGEDTFDYTICDTMGNCDTGTVTITINAPMLDVVDDTATTEENTPVDIDILANDSNIPSDGTLTVTSPDNGVVVINDGGTPDDISDDTITYTPNDGFIGEDSFDYTVCDAMGNCDTGTVTITINAPMLDVVDDTATTEENTPVDIDILANDSNIPSDGTLTVTSPDNGVVVINDGGTPDDISDDTITYTPNDGFTGEDSFDYTVCDTMGNCDTATVTITIAAYDVIDAVDDAYEATTAGGTLDGNVLDNDTLDGASVTISEVVITSTPTGPLTVNSDGTITVAADTAPGTYTIDYTICEIAIPSNCDTATVTITIAAYDVIDAVDDAYEATTAGGTLDGNVLDNDTLDGASVTISEVVITSTPTGPLTVNSDGTITVAADTAPGTYTIDYTICEIAIPSNCDTATVTVTIPAYDVIDAVDDAYEATTAGGTLDGNVLDNDTLDGASVSISEVVITSTPTGPLTVNSDGTVTVAADTAPGTYTIAYTICEIAVPNNCDTATVTVVIENQPFKIEVNQMVTPNSDGKNDFLFIRNVDYAFNNTLKIFNRWGVAVYEGIGYNNQNNVFDGRSKGRSTVTQEEYLPSGVYFYIFEYQDINSKNITDSGYIYVSK